jgi:hypothetical protein
LLRIGADNVFQNKKKSKTADAIELDEKAALTEGKETMHHKIFSATCK